MNTKKSRLEGGQQYNIHPHHNAKGTCVNCNKKGTGCVLSIPVPAAGYAVVEPLCMRCALLYLNSDADRRSINYKAETLAPHVIDTFVRAGLIPVLGSAAYGN